MKAKLKWSWLIGFMCILLACFVPTDVVKAEEQYTYVFDEKEQAYYISSVKGVEKNATIELPTSYNGYPVVGIKGYAFYREQEVKKVIIPYGYTSLEGSAFVQCNNLKEVVIDAEIQTLKGYTFWQCAKLEKVVLPETLKTIENYAILDSGLKTITIPESVKTIQNYAFYMCDDLYQVVVKGNKTKFQDWTFYGFTKDKLTIVAANDSEAKTYAESNGYLTSTSSKLKVVVTGKKMFVGEKKQISVYNNSSKVKWKSSKKSVATVSSNGLITAKKKGTTTISAKINGKTYKYKITVVPRTEKNVLSILYSTYVTKDMSDYEKVVAANKWLCQNVTYDYDNYLNGTIPYESYQAVGAFEKGVAVCDGYAKAFRQIMEYYGIPVYRVVGTANGGGHAWNLVQIGSRWYHVDTTWNDPVGSHLTWDYWRENYLLISDSKMDDDHVWYKASYPKASKKTPDKNITTLNTDGVRISTTSKKLYVGEKATLKVTGTTAKVSWSSANKKIATVNSKGKITAKKAGTTKIYCKINGKKYTVKVTVENPTLNESKLTMTKDGSTFTLKLTGATAKKFTSNKPSIVSVSKKGVLTAKAAGKATISVKASNGKTYKCEVNVREYAISDTAKTINLGETYQLSLNGADKDAHIKWKSSNKKVAVVDSKGIVSAIGKGTATISATIDGATFKCTLTVHEHSLSWQAESNQNEAKAKLICTTCKAVVENGVQLVDADGHKFYGKWSTELTNDLLLVDFNKRLKAAGYDAMVSDASFKEDILSFMMEGMYEEREEIIKYGRFMVTTAMCFWAEDINDALENKDYRIDSIYSWIEWDAMYKRDQEIQKFYAMTFIWDVYGDGSLQVNTCVTKWLRE